MIKTIWGITFLYTISNVHRAPGSPIHVPAFTTSCPISLHVHFLQIQSNRIEQNKKREKESKNTLILKKLLILKVAEMFSASLSSHCT